MNVKTKVFKDGIELGDFVRELVVGRACEVVVVIGYSVTWTE